MFSHFALIVCCLMLAEDGDGVDFAPRLPADRVQTVRKMYADLPTDVLGVAEPVTLAHADFLFDGGPTMFIILEDADGKRLHATLRAQKHPTLRAERYEPASWKYRSKRLEIGDGDNIDAGHKVILRGPEEAAFYGLLIRWSRTKS